LAGKLARRKHGIHEFAHCAVSARAGRNKGGKFKYRRARIRRRRCQTR
jgi:hypothetical protein